MLEKLKEEVCRANLELERSGLVVLSWGNVSGIDRERGLMVIKPSGVPYADLTPDRMAVVDMDGRQVDGAMKPSSDTPTHLELYRAFASIGGVCHSHAPKSTAWAQSCRPIPCLGTTHADYFRGPVPVTEPMNRQLVQEDYEKHTGEAIVQTFQQLDLDPDQMPAVLVSQHGPFTWGDRAAQAVTAAVVLEYVAALALDTLQVLQEPPPPFASWLLDKHYLRKHGPNAYYGQPPQKAT